MALSRSAERLAAHRVQVLGLAIAGTLAACSAGDSSQLGSGNGGASAGNGSGSDAVTVGAGPSSGTGGPDDCSEEAKLIYVVGDGNELHSFSPPSLTFSPIGTISCPAGGATPFSMAVDRAGSALVLFNDGKIFRVSTGDASCTTTTFAPNQATGFELFGMGFVSDEPGGKAETLFVGGFGGTGIGRIDVDTMLLSVVGAYDQVTGAAEITGTGDARLYGFFNGSNQVAQIDKQTSKILELHQPAVEIGDAWAFAFWGGSFYLFTNPSFGFSSQVDKYDPSTTTTSTVVASVGFRIVGAGVSTCAPVEPPE